MPQEWISDDYDSDDVHEITGRNRLVFHGNGTQSSVYRRCEVVSSTTARWIAVKTVSFIAQSRTKPHDIIKEARLLREVIDHPNVIEVLGFNTLLHEQQYEMELPLIPLSLNDLLESPYFVPRPFDSSVAPEYSTYIPPLRLCPGHERELFGVIVKSISFQILLALSYLHSHSPPIAHRDVKPSNMLIDEAGCVKLIDFGIAWEVGLNQGVSSKPKSPYDIPEETDDSMSCQVSSGQYRAIELLFSPQTYDACAIDLWSYGVVLSMFFTEPRWVRNGVYDESLNGDDAEEDEEDDEDVHSRRMRWSRRMIFKSSRGEIAQIFSVFSLLGTPTEASWPGFSTLPGAQAMHFRPMPPSEIKPLLVNLSPSYDDPITQGVETSLTSSAPASPLFMISQLLQLDPSKRPPASSFLSHPWFGGDDSTPLLLPRSHATLIETIDIAHSRTCGIQYEWNGLELRELYLPAVERKMKSWEDTL